MNRWARSKVTEPANGRAGTVTGLLDSQFHPPFTAVRDSFFKHLPWRGQKQHRRHWGQSSGHRNAGKFFVDIWGSLLLLPPRRWSPFPPSLSPPLPVASLPLISFVPHIAISSPYKHGPFFSLLHASLFTNLQFMRVRKSFPAHPEESQASEVMLNILLLFIIYWLKNLSLSLWSSLLPQTGFWFFFLKKIICFGGMGLISSKSLYIWCWCSFIQYRCSLLSSKQGVRWDLGPVPKPLSVKYSDLRCCVRPSTVRDVL